MTSGELLKQRNGFRITGGYGTPLPGTSQLALTGPTGAAAEVYRARMSGPIVARHFPGLIKTGDCLAVIAVREES